MITIRRIIRIIFEFIIAGVIFFFIATKTPLFERAIPELESDNIQTGTINKPIIDYVITNQSGVDITIPVQNPSWQTGVIEIIESNGNIVYIYPSYSNTTNNQWINSNNTIKNNSNFIIERPLATSQSCHTPRWDIISNNWIILAYQSSIEDNNWLCYSEIRVCKNGKLSGSFKYKVCSHSSQWKIITSDGSIQETIEWSRNSTQQFINLIWVYDKINAIPDTYIQPTRNKNNNITTIEKISSQSMSNGSSPQYIPQRIDTLDQFHIREIKTNEWKKCLTPRWQTINHGQYTYAYNTSKSSDTTACISEIRGCVDWKLSGTFTHKSCTIQSSEYKAIITNESFTQNKIVIASDIPYINPIQQAVYDTVDYNLLPWPKYCVTPRWQTLQHNQSVKTYQAPSSTSSTFCTSELRTCNNWSLWGSFSYQSCTEVPKQCITPRWQIIQHNQSVKAYRLPTSTSNSFCDSEIRVCSNGMLWGSYTYTSCTEKGYSPTDETRWQRRLWW